MLSGGGVAIPILSNLFLNYVLPKFKRVRVIPHDTRDFVLSLFQSAGLAQLLTQFIKNQTGRFRPCFYDMCGWNKDVLWDGVTNLCSLPHWEKEARKSFPSGHASFAWSTMLVLTVRCFLLPGFSFTRATGELTVDACLCFALALSL